MIKKSSYRLLDNPFIYKMSQFIFAPGANSKLVAELKRLAEQFETNGKLIDVGCGPSSWLWKVGVFPVGLDISHEYSLAYAVNCSPAITGSALALPFLDNAFDGVWCVGVLHHLTDVQAKYALCEMLRICRPGGYVVLMDAVLPISAWIRPVASLVRYMDRGDFMRNWSELEALLPGRDDWTARRFTYAYTGLEMFEGVARKSCSNL